MKQNKWTKILVAAGCCALATGAGVINLTSTAKAEDIYFQGVNVNSFEVLPEAEVRVVPSGTKEDTGIRFVSSMNSTTYNDLEALETDGAKVDYGMLIVPRDYLNAEGKGEVTEETVFGTGAVYCTEEADHDTTCTKTHIAKAEAETMTVNGTTAEFKGSLINIKTGNVHREFVGVAYVKYTSADDTTVDYQFATADNARSMTYLAQRAVQNKHEQADLLNDTYIQPLVDSGVQFKYTVEHYLPNEDGTYNETATKTEEELYADLNASVSATNIAKVDNTYGAYATYKMLNESGEKPTDIVYANGKTVLKCYYEKVNTTLFSASAGADSDEVKLLKTTNTDSSVWGRTSSADLVTDTVDGVEKQVLKITSADPNRDRDTVLDLQVLKERMDDAAALNWDYITIKMKLTAEFVAGCAGFDLTELEELGLLE